MKGGYYLIDCKGLDLIKGLTPQTIPGLRADVEKALASNKPVIACNCVWDEGPASPVAVLLTHVGDNIIATACTLQIIVSEASVVTINNLVA